jgi:hypothetical protein
MHTAQNIEMKWENKTKTTIVKLEHMLNIRCVNEWSYVRHSLAYTPVRCGSLQLCESFSQLTNLGEIP